MWSVIDNGVVKDIHYRKNRIGWAVLLDEITLGYALGTSGDFDGWKALCNCGNRSHNVTGFKTRRHVTNHLLKVNGYYEEGI